VVASHKLVQLNTSTNTNSVASFHCASHRSSFGTYYYADLALEDVDRICDIILK